MKQKVFLMLICFVLLAGTAVYQYFHFNDGQLHVVFCDVGQGDAILLRTPANKYILIDGGPDRKVLDCLSKHMPFWQRTIDLVLLTHPHADHFFGMFYVLERYDITSFATEKLENKSASFQELMKMLKERQISVKYVSQGDRWVLKSAIDKKNENVALSILGPTKDFLERTSPNGSIGDSKEFASLVTELSYGSFHVLFTGDSQMGELGSIAAGLDYKSNPIGILQSPHHGSKTGLNQTIVQQIAPKLAVISVGQHNRYGHPNKGILDIFQQEKIPVLRTDKAGDVEFVSQGVGFAIVK
jgi:competence protein ComEC